MPEFFQTDESFLGRTDGTMTPGSLRDVGDDADCQALAAALLDDPSVEDCVVVGREIRPGDQDLVAYVVVAEPRTFDQTEPRLRERSGGRISSFVPISYLPVTDEGTIDKTALARLPVWSAELAPAWEARIAALPDIDRVACVSGYWADTPRHVHVARLLRQPPPTTSVSRQVASPATLLASRRVAGPAPASVCHGGPVPERKDRPQVLADVLRSAPEDSPIIYINLDGTERAETYGSLLLEAQRLLGGLRHGGLMPGDKVILQLERGDDILPAFWSCVLGGFEPVIVPVPLTYDGESRALDHLIHIWNLFDRPVILTIASRIKAILGSLLRNARLAAIEDLRDSPPDMHAHTAEPDDIAFYTLSSGSTGLPKAVMLSHRNILARARGTSLLCHQSTSDVILNWLPFDHVGSISDWHLRCVDLGCKLVYAPKEYVLGRPLRWLDLIHRHHVTHSWAPNFAYSLVSAALKNESPRQWDLSRVQMLLTAGESITRATTREFIDSLAPYGLRPSVLQTAFGMAEVGSGVTYHQPAAGSSVTFHHIDRNSLGGSVEIADPSDNACVSFASLGPVIPGVSMRIVDDEQRVVPEGTTGRLHFTGDALSSGYYNNPEANVVFLCDGWFDTGDVGFISGGELMLTGRADAGIIINGANFYNNEIEVVVEQVDGVTASFTAACAVRPPDSESHKLAVFFYTPHVNDALLQKLLRAIQLRLTKQLGIKADFLIPVDRDAIPKTGIGKIQRKKLVEQFHRGFFQEILERLDLLARNENTLPDWFYRKVWHRKELLHGPRKQPGACLVFLDDLGLGQQIVTELTAFGVRCVIVESGETFAQCGPTTLSIRPDDPQHYRELVRWLRDSEIQITSIIHLFSYDDRGVVESRETIESTQRQGLYSVLSLTQALTDLAFEAPVRLLVVSSNVEAVKGDESRVVYAKATISGLLQSIRQELPWFHCLHVDCPVEATQFYAAAITRELLAPPTDQEVAYRGKQRFVSGLRYVDVSAHTGGTSRQLPFRRRGVYIVNNGLEGIGPYLAEFLLTQFEARVLLLGKDGLPTDGQTERQAIYSRLQQLAGACAYAVVDITDPESLQHTLESLQWADSLHGVIHLAGIPPERTLLEESQANLSTTFDAEMVSVWLLSQIIQKHQDSVFIVLSSAADVLDASGRCGLAASTAFQNGLISQLERQGNLGAYGFSLASWEDLTSTLAITKPETAVPVYRGINSFLIGLQLGQGRLLIGLDATSPLIQARTFDGKLDPRKITIFFTACGPVSQDQLRALPLVDRYGSPAQCDYVQMREPESAANDQVELWPSVAEYFVYDDLIYYALANDERRNQKYRIAMQRTVRDKIVVDIGTGKEAILARIALEAGARKVYAIEKGAEAFAQATAFIQKLGLDDQISIIHGDAAEVELPELADVCVSEIVGPIGGCEGAAVVINDAHRFLAPGGVMIPSRSTTRIAAIRLPDALLSRPGFYRVPGSYTEKIFAQIGYPFDLRVCIKKFPHSHLLSDAAVFEDLDFSHIVLLGQHHEIELTIDQESRFDGFLVWLNLQTIAGEVVDILEHEYSWLPVYMPVFDPGVDVSPGDRITATIARTLCDNGLNPDYIITGTLIRVNGETIDFAHSSDHHQKRYIQHPFYERLFSEDPVGLHPGCRPDSPLRHLLEIPLTSTGQVDLARLHKVAQGQNQEAPPRQVPLSEIEVQIAQVWQDVLQVAEVGVHDNFFELGGHSLLLVRAHNRLAEIFGSRLTLVDLFQYPTIHSLVQRLTNEAAKGTASQIGIERAQARSRYRASRDNGMVAVVGMACRFPGARTLDEFWRNLASGTESITFLDDNEIITSGIDPTVARHPDYVKASPILSDIESFDADLFGYTARDATLMDPQHRLLLECAWEALETAGYDPFTYDGQIGVYAGASMNTYLLNNVYPNRDTLDTNDSLRVTTLDSMGGFQLMVANDKDYLPTRLSYKLNLRGPSINVQTACSTGLVAIHLACQSLLNGEGDMFLAGGSSVQVPHRAGHLFQDGMIVSPDGHCRTFDAKAKGTVFGSGVGVVLLKRLDDAIRDRDHIFAVVKGSAVNNDGGMKVGYMAPSGDGQAAVVTEAMAMADVSPDTIGFVEAHGTGTEMGDPIEVGALTQAFRAHTEEKGFCAIGSVKTNVGHLQIASGMVGFIKTVLALQHKMIPPSLHFQTPNPTIDFVNSPFYVETTLTPWRASNFPRRAGVNSLGIGGTNGHVILEEAPTPVTGENSRERPLHILQLSARSETALTELADRYALFLADNPDVSLADVCFTANTGRRLFDYRLAVVAESVTQLRDNLTGTIRGQATSQARAQLAFLCTGQGSQYGGMGRQLYDTQPTFRQHLDRCAEILRPMLDVPLLDVLYPVDHSAAKLDETAYTQPALFALEYSLAELWKSWGITPSVVLGHSLGEYVAACIAGIFSLEDGLKLVAARARLMQALPQDGEMVVAFASKAEVHPFVVPFADQVAIAAENGPSHTVISGRTKAVESIRTRLHEIGLVTQKVKTSHAFHSPLMDPMLADFARIAKQIAYAPPRIDIISNVTGEIISDEIASPEYWCRHIRQPVKFMTAMETLAGLGYNTFVEIGPKPTLLGMAAGCLASDANSAWLPSLNDREGDWQQILHSLAQLSVSRPVDWMGFDRDYQRRRLPLPTYPFQRQRYWLDRPDDANTETTPSLRTPRNKLLGNKLRLPTLQTTIYENHFDTQALPFLQDHRVFDETVVSGACHVSMLLAAIAQTVGQGAYVVKDIYFPQPLVVPQGQSRTVQVALTPAEQSTSLQVVSFAMAATDDDPIVSTHVEGRVEWGQQVGRSTSESQQIIWDRCRKQIPVEAFFQAQADRHIHLGPSYRWIDAIRRGDGEAICRLRPPALLGGLDTEPLHPGLLDACFGLLLATVDLPPEDTWLPFSIEEVRVHQIPDPTQCWGHLVLRQTGNPARVIADVRLCDQSGQVMMEFVGLQARPASQEAIQQHLQTVTSGLLYNREWRPMATGPVSPQADKPTQWLIFADQYGIAENLAQRLRTLGDRCLLVTPAQTYSVRDQDHYCINPTQPQDFNRLLQQTVEGPHHGVIHSWSLNEPSPEDEDWLSHRQTLACGSVLHLVQALGKAGWTDAARLWLVTRGAQPLGNELPHIEQMPLWGLGQVVALEHPGLQCTCVDLDPTADRTDITSLLETIRASDEEPQIAWRQGIRYVTRLLQQPESIANGRPLVHRDGSYIITGGTGGLGLSAARWLAAQGARDVVLVSRRQASQAATEAIKRIEQTGAKVRVVQADVSDRVAMTQVFAMVQTSLPALRGVIHCAGIIADGMLAEESWERFQTVFPAKIDGAWHLHELTAGLDLDFFVLFSSAASILGNQGQGNYAAGNAFLDGLAHYRRSRGLVATSINWGPWDQVGIAVSDPTIQTRMARQGFLGIKPENGFALLNRILAGTVTQVSAINWNWQTYLDQLAGPRRLFSELIKTSQSTVADTNLGAQPEILRQLSHASRENRRNIVSTFVHDTVRRTLGVHDGHPVDPAQPLTEQGLDSLMAVQIRNAIANGLRQSLPVSLVFNYPTVNEIIDYLETRLNDAAFAMVETPAGRAQDRQKGGSVALAAQELLADINELLNERA